VGIIHVASDVSFSPDPTVVIPAALRLTKAALEASAETPSVKRFVQTSSSTAAAVERVNEVYDLTPETWNDLSVAESGKPGPYGPENALSTYAASKTLQEKSLWTFIEEERPAFVANAVLPDFNVGKIINIEKQGYPSSVALLKAAFEGNMELATLLGPQHGIDVQDCALLHIAALLSPDAKSERIFGYAYPKNWTNTIQYFKELYPERNFSEAPKDEGEDLANVTGKARAEELLKWIAGKRWTSYKDSIKLVTDTLIQSLTVFLKHIIHPLKGITQEQE
jgi:nucleoside-diphosphate-sugar epimerase